MLVYVNGAPFFTSNPFGEPNVNAGQPYSGSIAGQATDPNPGDNLSFAKVGGPAWLNVASNGTLSVKLLVPALAPPPVPEKDPLLATLSQARPPTVGKLRLLPGLGAV